jgi:DNA-directed RNA polymerase II subunit RPB1
MNVIEESSLVNTIEFGLFDPDVLKRYSVVEVEKPNAYENGVALIGGLASTALGVASRDQTCTTCTLDLKDCPGHFEHIDLAKPSIHPGYASFIYKILQSICYSCGRLLISYCHPELLTILLSKHGRNRLIAVNELIGKSFSPSKNNAGYDKKSVDAATITDEVSDPRFWEIVNGRDEYQLHKRRR